MDNHSNPYFQPKPENDIDLVGEVRTILLESGLGLRVNQYYDRDRLVMEANNKPSHVQRFLLNRYWNHQLMSANASSIDERFCLIPNGSPEDWLKLFKAKIVPFLIEHNLPGEL